MSLKGIGKALFNAILRREFPMKEPGTEAPPIDTTDHLGRPISLNALRGKYVVLWFYPAADTPG